MVLSLRIEEPILLRFRFQFPQKILVCGNFKKFLRPGWKTLHLQNYPSNAELSCHQHIRISYKTVSVKGLQRRYWILTPYRIETCAPWRSVAVPFYIGLRFVAMGALWHILRTILTVYCEITSFKTEFTLTYWSMLREMNPNSQNVWIPK